MISEMEDLQKAEQGFWIAEKNRNFCDLALNTEKQAKIADLEKTVTELQEKLQKTETELAKVKANHETVKRWWMDAESLRSLEANRKDILMRFIRHNCADANEILAEVNSMQADSVNPQPDTPEEERLAVRLLLDDLTQDLAMIKSEDEDD